jgi:YcaO-like protein with predicted kinase domain
MFPGAPSQDTQKRYARGTHRTCAPAETVARMKPHLSQLGITRVANVTGLDILGIPTTMVTRPNGRSLSVHQGKGLDIDAARASGIMEAAEHHLAEHVDPPGALLTAAELRRTSRVADVSRLPQSIRKFGADDRIPWMEAKDLTTGEAVWVPYEMVHVDLRLPLPPASGFFPLGSNGLASGNHVAEAAVHGICELVERDAIALFYQESVQQQEQRKIDPATVEDDVARELMNRFDAAGVELAAWDITSDVGVASVFCMAVDRIFDPFRPVGVARGSGTHLNRGVALARALCEAAQSRLTRIVGARDDLREEDFARLRAPQATAGALAQMRASHGGRPFASLPTRSSVSIDDDLRLLIGLLAERGLTEVLAVDLTRRDLPCCVVRAIVPGLEGVFPAPSYHPGTRAASRRDEGAS